MNHVFGAEVEHALRGFGGEFLNRVGDDIFAKMLGNGNDVVARNHQRFAGAFAVAPPFFEHRGEARPAFGRRMLAAKLAFAVAPSSGGNDGGNAGVHSGGVNRYGGAETAANQGDLLRIDLGMRGEKRERVARVGNLVQADDAAALALAFAAAAHVETQGGVAQGVEHVAGSENVSGIFVAAETVQDDKRGESLAGCRACGNADDAGELQAVGIEM